MEFNKETIKEKTDKFWDAYFKLLDRREKDKGKYVDETPPTIEFPIDENYLIGSFRGINFYVWSKRDDDHVSFTTFMGARKTGVRLLYDYLLDILDYYEEV